MKCDVRGAFLRSLLLVFVSFVVPSIIACHKKDDDDPPPPPSYPDLYDVAEFQRYFSPTTISAGQSFTVRTELKNGSLSVASGGFWVDFYASTNTTITTSDYFIGDAYVSGITPNDLAIAEWTGSFPSGIPDGTYWVGWIIDSTYIVTESNEANNTAYKTSYQLIVDSGDSYEPNDTLATAYYLGGPLGTYTANAYISSSTDIDCFSVTQDAGYTITITLDQLPADYDLELYNSSGTFLAGSYNGGTITESISYTVLTTASYYVVVYGYNGAYSTTNQYRLTVNVP